jgi:hypothetical protein
VNLSPQPENNEVQAKGKKIIRRRRREREREKRKKEGRKEDIITGSMKAKLTARCNRQIEIKHK